MNHTLAVDVVKNRFCFLSLSFSIISEPLLTLFIAACIHTAPYCLSKSFAEGFLLISSDFFFASPTFFLTKKKRQENNSFPFFFPFSMRL